MANRKCPSCSTENNEEASFCRHCGAKLAVAQQFRPQAVGGEGPSGKKKTMVDPALAGGAPGVVPQGFEPGGLQGGHSGPAPRGPKKHTVVDNAVPSGGPAPGRKLVGFLISYDLDPGGLGRFFPLYQGRMTLGREGSDADICLSDSGVTKIHATLRFMNGRLAIRDEMSSNGTYVDIDTVPQQKHPELYRGGAASLKAASFDGRSVSFLCIEDERITLRDGSLLKLGNTVLEAKLVGAGPARTVPEDEF